MGSGTVAVAERSVRDGVGYGGSGGEVGEVV